MKEIQLTQGKMALVDDEDYDFLNQWKWHAHKCGNTIYARRHEGKKLISMHRVILGIIDSKTFVDHRDRDGLNNIRNNLRTATSSQNCANTRKSINSTSKFIGVSWYNRDKRWCAAITKNRATIHLGSFKNEADAALAYNQAAIKYHGEFANLNTVS